jgi:4-diphosphocytidyl-2-C-methyl-D-erythritol kinase
LEDEVILTDSDQMTLECGHPAVPTDRRNLAWKVADALSEATGIRRGVHIEIIKRIPVAAGLAGGSSDAAAVLIGLNRLWNLNLSRPELAKIGATVGADIPFCIYRGTMRARGIGEKLIPIASKLHCRVLLVTPSIEVPTARVYQSLKVAEIRRHPPVDRVVEQLEQGNLQGLYGVWGNVLEEVTVPAFPEVAEAKGYFERYGMECLMSGSGPSVFALNPPEQAAQSLLAGLPKDWFGCITGFREPGSDFL